MNEKPPTDAEIEARIARARAEDEAKPNGEDNAPSPKRKGKSGSGLFDATDDRIANIFAEECGFRGSRPGIPIGSRPPIPI